MTKVKFIKIAGLIGAVITGAVQIAAGDLVGGIGVISAALASAGVFTPA